MMQRVRYGIGLVALLLAGAVGMVQTMQAPGAAASARQEAVVSMQFNQFVPTEIAVAAGTTVVWLNEDYASGEFHDVIADDRSFVSDVFGPGSSFSVLFEFPGTYTYYCSLHVGMNGTVVVQ